MYRCTQVSFISNSKKCLPEIKLQGESAIVMKNQF